jgi:hypothetical protein
VSVAALTGGIACAVGGAVLPRTSGTFSGAGVSGTLLSVPQLLEFARAHAQASIPDDDPDKEEKVARVIGHAYDLLASGAGQKGLTFAHTSGAQSFTLTGRKDGEVATATVDVPSLLRRAFDEGTRSTSDPRPRSDS